MLGYYDLKQYLHVSAFNGLCLKSARFIYLIFLFGRPPHKKNQRNVILKLIFENDLC